MLRKLFIALMALSLLVSAGLAEVPSAFNEAVKQFIEKKGADWADGEIQVKLKSGDSFFSKFADDKEVKYRISEGYALSKLTPNLVLPVEAYKGEETLDKAYVSVKIEVLKQVLVAKNKIQKKKTIALEDITIETKDVALYPNKYFEDETELIGKMSNALIPKGSVILEWMVKEKPAVNKGDKIRLLAREGGVEVWASGVALEDGQIGEEINVRRSGSREKLDGKILSSEIIEVRVP